VVRPRSCRVIYYFDTPTLGRRHQLFGRVTILGKYHLCWGLLVHLIKMFALVMDKGWCSWADPYHNILTRDEHKKYKIITKIGQLFKKCSIKNQARKNLYSLCFNMQQLMCISNLKIKFYKRVFIVLETNPQDSWMDLLDAIWN
jgi:hypothetical protein